MKIRNQDKITHGMSKTRQYKAWFGMIDRCRNKNNIRYENYGGRGITVCEEWLKFENFFKDMGIRPKYTSLERINNDKNYCKENCKWGTSREQNKNKRPYSNSGFKGVYKHGNKYKATIGFDKKVYHIGVFNNPELASLAFESCQWVLDTSEALLKSE